MSRGARDIFPPTTLLYGGEGETPTREKKTGRDFNSSLKRGLIILIIGK
jgi:hypothetical protein